MGQGARFERFVADMLFIIAAGKRIDDERTPRFSEILDRIYQNPFKVEESQKMTASDIKEHILQKIRETKKRLGAEG